MTEGQKEGHTERKTDRREGLEGRTGKSIGETDMRNAVERRKEETERREG